MGNYLTSCIKRINTLGPYPKVMKCKFCHQQKWRKTDSVEFFELTVSFEKFRVEILSMNTFLNHIVFRRYFCPRPENRKNHRRRRRGEGVFRCEDGDSVFVEEDENSTLLRDPVPHLGSSPHANQPSDPG